MGAVRLKIVADEGEAEVVCGLLRAEGIECFQRVTDLTAEAVITGVGWREILVRDVDLARARELVEAVEPVIDECARCGREVGGDTFWFRDEAGELAPYCAICAERLFGPF